MFGLAKIGLFAKILQIIRSSKEENLKMEDLQMRFARILVISIFVVVLAGCTKQQTNQITAQQALTATTKASALLHDIDNLSDGVKAEDYKQQILDQLYAVNGNLTSIGSSITEIDQKIKNAWYRDATKQLADLRQPSAEISRGESLRQAFLTAQRKSGQPLSAYGVNEQKLSGLVARYYLVGAKKQGVTLTPADYHAAGLPVTKELVVKYQRPPAAKLTHKTKSTIKKHK
jgi:hypothetical protein